MHCVLGVPVRRVVGCKGLGFARAGFLWDVYLVLWSRFHSVQKLQKRCNKVVIGYKELLAACAGTLAGVFRELSNLSPSGESFCAENGQTKGPQLICQSSAEWDTAGVNPPPPISFLSWVRTSVFGSGVESLRLGHSRKKISPSTRTF